jgi:hypothetical protein
MNDRHATSWSSSTLNSMNTSSLNFVSLGFAERKAGFARVFRTSSIFNTGLAAFIGLNVWMLGPNSLATPLIISLSNQTTDTVELTTSGDIGHQHILLSSNAIVGLTNAIIKTPVSISPVNSQGNSSFTVSLTASPAMMYSVRDFAFSPCFPTETNGIKIIAFPHDSIVTNTGTAYFTVIAEKSDYNDVNEVQYQWYKNEITMLGQTNATLVLTNVRFTTNIISTNVLSTNTDVGFYSCDVNVSTNNAVRVRSIENGSPGARLYVFTGEHTTIHGPIGGPGPGPSCIGNMTGWMRFLDESTGTPYFYKLSGTTNCTLRDLTRGPAGYSSKIYYYNASMNGCGDGVLSTMTYPATHPVTFFPTTSSPYLFSLYVTSSPFPTGSQFTLDVKWHNGPFVP